MNKGKMVSDQLRDCTKKIDRRQIREVFLRNGFTIKPGHDDLKDYVYEAAFELLELTVLCGTCAEKEIMNEGQADDF